MSENVTYGADGSGDPAFSEIAHTADCALRIRGKDFAGLLQNAALGLYSLIGASKKEKAGGNLIEKLRQLLVALVRASESAVARDDEEFAADLLVEIDRLGKFVTPQVAGADVGGGRLQIQRIQLPPEFLGLAVVRVVAGELDTVDTQLREGGESAVEILGAITAHRIQLHGNRDFPPPGRGGEDLTPGQCGGTQGRVFEKMTSG